MSSTPNTCKLMQAVADLRAVVENLLATDPDLAADDVRFADYLASDPESAEAMDLVHQTARAALAAADRADLAKQSANDLVARAKRFEHRAERLRDAVLVAMQALELKRIEAIDMTLSVRTSQPGTQIVDETKIPERFFVTTRALSRDVLRRALLDGEVVDGAELRNPRPSLGIRTK